MKTGEPAETALEPLRAAMIQQAHSDADGILDQARADARAECERAEAEAAAITERATAAGRARAAGQLAAEHRAAARHRRARVLVAQREAYDRWRAAGAAAVSQIRTEPGYGEILAGLRAFATRTLGPDVAITEDPAGGLMAQGGGLILDLRLSTIAAHALDRVEPEIGGLWT
jgi:vacuolar-type H+-ATPase subunit E/Vma4